MHRTPRLSPATAASAASALPLAAFLALAGCPAPPTSLARAQQTAQEFNLDSRFGRGEAVMDRVAPDARDDYTSHHRVWGSAVRVADVELAGMRPHGEHDVEVFVRVAWYRIEDEDLRSTTLQQTWHDKPDGSGWQLVAERRVEGDLGLLGETIVYQAPATPRPPAQFPTVRLGGAGD
jgi:hypothetical protein